MAHAGRRGEPDGGLESISDDRTSNDSCTKTQPTNPRETIFYLKTTASMSHQCSRRRALQQTTCHINAKWPASIVRWSPSAPLHGARCCKKGASLWDAKDPCALSLRRSAVSMRCFRAPFPCAVFTPSTRQRLQGVAGRGPCWGLATLAMNVAASPRSCRFSNLYKGQR